MTSTHFLFSSVASGCVLLCSCGAMKSIGENTANGFGKVAEVVTNPFGPKVEVVEAREDALKELESGEEKALAYQRAQTRRRSFWIFGPPVNFKEPELPDDAGAADSGLLLPPKF